MLSFSNGSIVIFQTLLSKSMKHDHTILLGVKLFWTSLVLQDLFFSSCNGLYGILNGAPSETALEGFPTSSMPSMFTMRTSIIGGNSSLYPTAMSIMLYTPCVP